MKRVIQRLGGTDEGEDVIEFVREGLGLVEGLGQAVREILSLRLGWVGGLALGLLEGEFTFGQLLGLAAQAQEVEALEWGRSNFEVPAP